MTESGLCGLPRPGRRIPNLIRLATPADLVNRHFAATRPNELWRTDITEHRAPWILSVVATRVIYACSSKAVNRSAGVSQPRVFRGRVLSCSATAWRSVTL